MIETTNVSPRPYEPEVYCLRCHMLEWDDEQRCCANFHDENCPLGIRQVLAELEVDCLVI